MNMNKPVYSILCVDDEDDFLNLLEDTVKSFHFNALRASTGAEALEILKSKSNEIVLIISDVQMPQMDGFELRKKCLEANKDIPFVILSGYVSREDTMKAFELKIARFLDKPIDLATLEVIIREVAAERIAAMKEERELLEGFVADAEMLLEEFESILLSMEGGNSSPEAINRVFAIAHTIKGSSGFFKPDTIHRFTHKFEDFLSPYKRDNRDLDSGAIGVCLKSMDVIKSLLQAMVDGRVSEYSLEELVKAFEVKTQNDRSLKDSSEEQGQQHPKGKAVEAKAREEVRVGVDLLDQFMEISGEITVIRNVINKQVRKIEKEFAGNRDVALLTTMIDEMLKINGSLQDKVVELRKVQLKNVVRPLHRTVRDLSDSLKKEIHLEIDGETLKVDTAIAEVLGSSLIHMVRNSADHGIEMPTDREKAGKNKHGTIKITARQVSDQIVVELADDGKGLNRDLIRKKIVEKGMKKDEEALKMPDSEIFSMIFESGFSTAAKITDVSGRGVGMDMVKKSIQKIGGKIDIHSSEGKGTRFVFSLPVPKSVTIVSSLLVRATDGIYSLPQDSILKVMSLNAFESSENSEEKWAIRKLAGAHILEISGKIYPLIDLGKSFHHEEGQRNRALMVEQASGYLVILNSNGYEYGIKVDEVLDLEDSVVKKLGKHLKELSFFAGATFLGENEVGLVLDLTGLAESHGLKTGSRSVAKQEVKEHVNSGFSSQEVLLLDIAVPGVWGVPLNQVGRLEKFKISDMQFSGEQSLMIYRGKTMPLHCLGYLLRYRESACFRSADPSSEVTVIVVEKGNQSVGLIVKEVIDLARTTTAIEPLMEERKGVLGATIINDQTVTMVCLETLLQENQLLHLGESKEQRSNAA